MCPYYKRVCRQGSGLYLKCFITVFKLQIFIALLDILEIMEKTKKNYFQLAFLFKFLINCTVSNTMHMKSISLHILLNICLKKIIMEYVYLQFI